MSNVSSRLDAEQSAELGKALVALLTGATALPASELTQVVHVAGQLLGASSARVLVPDYGLTALLELGDAGASGRRESVEGTLPGRCFSSGETLVAGTEPSTVWVLLAEGGERLGVLELVHPAWPGRFEPMIAPIVRMLVLILISKRRHTDVVLRARRAEPLAIAAEIQWALLPPLTYETDAVSLSGIVEPAYSIGGDCFDFAINPDRAELAIVDAVGHGLEAVSIAVLALNGIRNARREQHSLRQAYLDTGDAIRSQVPYGIFATGQIASLELATGELTWLNAGHPLPLLVRDQSFIGELACAPSLPMGLGGTVTEVATAQLQPGDRVLFYTDGVTESRGRDGERYGTARLADLFVRGSTEEQTSAETARRLGAAVLTHNAGPLRDDATFLMLEYHGRPTAPEQLAAPPGDA